VRLEIKPPFNGIYSLVFILKLIGIGQLVLKLLLVVRWYTFFETQCIILVRIVCILDCWRNVQSVRHWRAAYTGLAWRRVVESEHAVGKPFMTQCGNVLVVWALPCTCHLIIFVTNACNGAFTYICEFVCVSVCLCCRKKTDYAINSNEIYMYSVTDHQHAWGQKMSVRFRRHGSACRYDCIF